MKHLTYLIYILFFSIVLISCSKSTPLENNNLNREVTKKSELEISIDKDRKHQQDLLSCIIPPKDNGDSEESFANILTDWKKRCDTYDSISVYDSAVKFKYGNCAKVCYDGDSYNKNCLIKNCKITSFWIKLHPESKPAPWPKNINNWVKP